MILKRCMNKMLVLELKKKCDINLLQSEAKRGPTKKLQKLIFSGMHFNIT